MLIKNSVYIQANPERVFDFLSKPEKLPLWNYYVERVENILTSIEKTGSRYRQIRKNDEQIFEITGFEKNRLLVFSTLPDSKVQFNRQLIIENRDGNTLLNDRFELDTGYPGIIQNVFKNRVKKAILENLNKLKQLMETGRTTLQDGRIKQISD
jgi:uncharacterized protein YndB with AHSA1/START domain